MKQCASRRQFSRLLASGLVLAGFGQLSGCAARRTFDHKTQGKSDRLRIAAIQMHPRLADVDANLRQAEHLVRAALERGAQWVILPEFFSSGMAFHPDMPKAIRPAEGAPKQLLLKLARDGNAVVGGSFLAQRGSSVYNMFVLAFPDGRSLHHDKDFPTYWENCYYIGGTDEGVLRTAEANIGVALCWEFIRSQTARRLRGKVDFIVGGSCWWTLPDEAPRDHPLRSVNLTMLREAPVRLARMLGVPVVHASHVGRFEGFWSPELDDVSYNSEFLGQTQIVDAQGRVIAKMEEVDSEGFVVAEIELDRALESTQREPIPERFWIPVELPEAWKESWERWLRRGPACFEETTRPHLPKVGT